MSYLSFPRLQFTAFFTANPSTLNNTLGNYDVGTTGQLEPSWNQYGSHAWTITGGVVTSFVDPAGMMHTSGDPLIGATIQNVAKGPPAVLVDLDPDQQQRTQLFGLNLDLSLPGGSLLKGGFLDTGCLANLWFARAGRGDSGAGGCFQSLLENCVWGELVNSSPLLQQLRAASPQRLSIRLTTYAYDDNNSSPTFNRGKLVGVIGPWSADEPKYIAGNRMLAVPTPPAGQSKSVLWNAPARIDAGRSVLLLDLGNAIPEVAPGGPRKDLGQLQAAFLPAAGTPVLLGSGPIDYSAASYGITAGIAQVPLTADQVKLAQTTPLGLLTTHSSGAPVTIQGQTWQIGLAEAKNGLYATTDEATVRMEPGDTAHVTLYAWTFGHPATALKLPLQLASNPFVNAWDNVPASGLQFPGTITTDATGRAKIDLLARDPVPKPTQRKNIDGQVYFIGGPWVTTLDFYEGGPLTVKVYNSLPPQPHPTWKDVAPILQQYYVLYGYMASIVDLSNYNSVKANSTALKTVLRKPFSDPGHMPVTRDMSRDARNMILAWLDQGCPA